MHQNIPFYGTKFENFYGKGTSLSVNLSPAGNTETPSVRPIPLDPRVFGPVRRKILDPPLLAGDQSTTVTGLSSTYAGGRAGCHDLWTAVARLT